MRKELAGKKVSRRTFLKLAGVSVVALAAVKVSKRLPAAESIAEKRLAMVIDLQRCAGCGACIIACKNENNVQTGFLWANKIDRTAGKFPNVRYDFIPTLCNHCERAPCVRVCPTGAMHKGEGDITMNNPQMCIGCKACIAVCPYGVISFNQDKIHKFWRDDKPLIKGSTSSPQEVTQKVKGKVIPYYNPDREGTLGGAGLRYKGIVEKCTLCDHRVKRGKLPYCVEACPTRARIFGDLNDPNSKVNQILGKHTPFRLKEHLGTEPKIFYVRRFNVGTFEKTKGQI
jgi:molybdopterin-containing oxidoreductase family iron-sulfur binding subunit